MQVSHAKSAPAQRLAQALARLSALALTVACTGTIEPAGGGSPGVSSGGGAMGPHSTATGEPSGGSTGSAVGANASPAADCGSPSPGASPLRRLSNAEYRNTVNDLFSDVPDIAARVAQATDGFPAEPESLGFRNSAQFLTVQALGAQKYMDAAESIASAVASVPSLVPCTPQSGAEMSCARTFIQDLGKRMYRRPLSAEESSRYETQFQTALTSYGFSTGVEWTVFTMLQSPSFLYRVERGQPSTQRVTRPTPYETATRLSYLFWQSQPDAALVRAAESGDLDTPSQIEARARSMLKDPRSERLFQYFAEWLGLNRLDDFTRDAKAFPSLPADLANLYRDESQAFIQSLLSRPDGSFEELLTAPYTYVNETLATVYGLEGVTGSSFVRVDDPARSGILTQAMLAAQDKPYRTSIVRRGLKVRTGLLCETIPAPPNDVPLDLDSIDPSLSQRDRLAEHRKDPTCAGCHSLLDPIGVVFESFDAIGRYRTVDETGQSIDTSSTISGTRDANGSVEDVRDLGALLAASSEARDCYVTQTFRFFFGRDVQPEDACSVALLKQRFESQRFSLSELLVALTQTDAFLYRATPEVNP